MQCTVVNCDCTREIQVRLFTGSENNELIERPYELQCTQCGHSPKGHATLSVVRAAPIERRSKPRD